MKIKITDYNLEELFEMVARYSIYVMNYAEEHGVCKDGCYPVCFEEFVHNDLFFEEID